MVQGNRHWKVWFCRYGTDCGSLGSNAAHYHFQCLLGVPTTSRVVVPTRVGDHSSMVWYHTVITEYRTPTWAPLLYMLLQWYCVRMCVCTISPVTMGIYVFLPHAIIVTPLSLRGPECFHCVQLRRTFSVARDFFEKCIFASVNSLFIQILSSTSHLHRTSNSAIVPQTACANTNVSCFFNAHRTRWRFFPPRSHTQKTAPRPLVEEGHTSDPTLKVHLTAPTVNLLLLPRLSSHYHKVSNHHFLNYKTKLRNDCSLRKTLR
jgi:hypothetical protein